MIGQLFLGLFVPAATPGRSSTASARPPARRWRTTEFQKVLLASGLEASSDSSPEKAQRFINEETARWGPVVKAAGFKVE